MYTPEVYSRRIAAAVKAANAKTEAENAGRGEGEERKLIPHWFPHQLRHTCGTLARKMGGLEGAQTLLGHQRANVTEIYAERDMDLAAEVAKKIG